MDGEEEWMRCKEEELRHNSRRATRKLLTFVVTLGSRTDTSVKP